MGAYGYGIMSSVQICKVLTDRWSVVEAYSILDSAESFERARILQSLGQLTNRVYDKVRPSTHVLRTSLIRKLMFANSFLRMCSNSPLSLMSEDIVIINTEWQIVEKPGNANAGVSLSGYSVFCCAIVKRMRYTCLVLALEWADNTYRVLWDTIRRWRELNV